MSYPLINPFQQFLDTSGDPLVDGTIEFRDPTSNALIDSFPTADDADAQTNANDNPLTLNSSGAAPGGLFLEDGVDYKVIIKDAAGATVVTYDDVLCPVGTAAAIGALLWPISALETSNGVTPTDYTYPWGDTRRYGSVADSGDASQGTDNKTAFQNAVNSGHPVYIPEGWYACESTVEVFNNATGGGTHIEMAAGVRIERYANVATPILHVAGTRNKIEGNGAILAARTYGGFTKGLFLLGPDPAITVTTGDSCLATQHNWITDLFIIGSTSVGTDWDGSVGFYGESAARKRGDFITPTAFTTYYNVIRGVRVTQMDYGFFGGTDFNANTFTNCGCTSFGHSSFMFNGYANQVTDVSVEKGTAQDTTERFVFNFGNKDSGPESSHTGCDYGATEYTITGITKGATTVITVSSDPTGTVAVADKIKVSGITDSGAGDLASALNGGHFEVTARNTTTITISADTSGDSATWSSGGIVSDGIYPILGARANQIHGFTEVGYVASTTVVRLIGCTLPVGAYDTGTFENTYGRNCVRVSGTYPGGIGPSGFSTAASLLNNMVDVTSVGLTDYGRPVRLHDFVIAPLDDATGSGWGGEQYRVFAGRMASAVESTAYNVLTVDNVGATNGSILIKLTYLMREEVNADHEGGEIGWLCPVTAATARTPIKYKDFQANYNSAAQPFVNWSVVEAAGTAASTGKFTLTATTESVAGTGDFDISWKAEVMSEYGVSLDFDADVTVTNGGL